MILWPPCIWPCISALTPAEASEARLTGTYGWAMSSWVAGPPVARLPMAPTTARASTDALTASCCTVTGLAATETLTPAFWTSARPRKERSLAREALTGASASARLPRVRMSTGAPNGTTHEKTSGFVLRSSA